MSSPPPPRAARRRITFFWNASDEAARPEFQRLHTVWEDHTHRVWALRFSQCGSWMATASWDKTVNVYAMSYAAVGAESPDATFTSFGEELGAMLGDEEINVPHKLNVRRPVSCAGLRPSVCATFGLDSTYMCSSCLVHMKTAFRRIVI